MKNQRLPFEEFKTLFRDKFKSEEELKREYDSFLLIFEQLDQTSVPKLTSIEKIEIFERTWQEHPRKSSWGSTWHVFFKHPAMTFALGIVIGCILTMVFINGLFNFAQTASADQSLTVEQTRSERIFKGKVISEIYPLVENPKIVLEKTEGSSNPKRVLYGTLDKGEIYIVWNL